MTQKEIKNWICNVDEIISRRNGVHSMGGFCETDFVVAKDGCIYEITHISEPAKANGIHPYDVTWTEPELIRYGHQLSLNLVDRDNKKV